MKPIHIFYTLVHLLFLSLPSFATTESRFVLETNSSNPDQKYVAFQIDNFKLKPFHLASVFSLITNPDGSVSFFLLDQQRFLCPMNDRKKISTTTENGTWEKFKVEQRSRDFVSLKSVHGRYLMANFKTNKLEQINHAQEWEKFRLVPVNSSKVTYIRHGEAEHNVRNEYHLPDPKLTEKGKNQCLDSAKAIITQGVSNSLDALITSPMFRTIQTTHLVFADNILNHKTPVIAHPLIREGSGAVACDLGSDKDWLAEQFGHIDFDLVPKNWETVVRGSDGQTRDIREFFNWLCDSFQDKHVAVISHGGTLSRITGQHPKNAEFWTSTVACPKP